MRNKLKSYFNSAEGAVECKRTTFKGVEQLNHLTEVNTAVNNNLTASVVVW